MSPWMSFRRTSCGRQWRSWEGKCWGRVASMTARSSRRGWTCCTRRTRSVYVCAIDRRVYVSGNERPKHSFSEVVLRVLSACLSWRKHISIYFLSEYLQRIRDLEDKTEIQRRQIKDLEEKVRRVKCLSEKKKPSCEGKEWHIWCLHR